MGLTKGRDTMNEGLRKSLMIYGVAISITAMPICAIADSANGAEPNIEGTWVGKVTSLVGPPVTFLSMTTFLPGGRIIEENSSPAVRSLAQGEWVRTGHRQFVRTMYLFNFAAPRTFIGMTKVVNYIELTHDGDTYDSLADFEVYDVNGNLVTIGHNIAQARRCTAVTTVPHCMGIGD
jgi:hypothetical protein